MPWIKVVPPNSSPDLIEAVQQMRRHYPPEYGTPVPSVDEIEKANNGWGIVGSHSLLPETLLHSFSAFGTLMASDLPLSRRDHEMIATAVSVINGCFY